MRIGIPRLALLAAAFAGCATSPPQAVEANCPDVALVGLRCTSVTVPENRATGKGRTIALRVAVLPARRAGRAADPVFFLAGGPGQAASVFLSDPNLASDLLGERRDLVFVDQRGTGGSNGLLCSFYGETDYASGRFAKVLWRPAAWAL